MNRTQVLQWLAAFSGMFGAGLWGWVFCGFFLEIRSPRPSEAPARRGFPMTLTPSQKVLAVGILAGLAVTFFMDMSLGLAVLFLSLLGWTLFQKAPHWKKNRDSRKKQARMAEVFPQTLGMAVQALKTGQTIPQVLEYLSRECPTPLREEWVLVCNEIDLGSSAEQALAKMGERYPTFSELHQFLESYKISRQTGANLTHLLGVLLEGLDEKNRILRKMEAMTAQARLSGLMMGLLPVLLGVVFFCMDPHLILPLFTEKMGWGILSIAVVLETIGFYWIKLLLRLEV